ncbi:hypothetical protein ACIGXM_18560 [Kitasatospora sp. NPDC052896]|uniref:hypothetical protein n=1 Tax=Kitasatospora sp. NPDC052896 TaxID=3364061 RepID=UPI0037C547A7
MNDRLPRVARPLPGPAALDPLDARDLRGAYPASAMDATADSAHPATAASANPSGFPLPQRHRRILACAAVAASIALGGFGVGATVETVQHGTVNAAAASH